jgi:hypothetical protein
LFAVIGTVFVVVGIRGIRSTRVFERIAARVPGMCVDLVLRHSGSASVGESHSTWHPILAFATLEGRQMTIESPWGGVPAPARRGQQVTVLYDPRQPARARVDGWIGRGTPFYVFAIILGSLFGGLGWLVLAVAAYAVLT